MNPLLLLAHLLGSADRDRGHAGRVDGGWKNKRPTNTHTSPSWRAVKGDLAMAATYEYAHVQLGVTVRVYGPGRGNDGWTVAASLTIDPGEQLSQIATDLRRLMST